MTKQYRILNLHAENIKKIKVIDITTDPNSDTVIISGANGNGKSSVLDCIEMACRGGDSLPDMPIRRGEEKGLIEMNLGDLKIRRTFTDKGSYLFVESADGARYPQPQAMLDKMMGSISFDPLEFTRIKPKEQYETIRKLVPLKIDLDALEAQIKTKEGERTIANRQVKELTAQVNGMVIPEGTPDEPVDVSVKSQAIIKANSDHQEVFKLSDSISAGIARATELKAEIESLKEKLETGEKWIEDKKAEREKLKSALLSATDLEALQVSINSATEVNAAVALRATKNDLQKKLDSATGAATDLDRAITTGREQKAEAIAEAKMPVKGLSLEDGMVMFDNIPLSQASTAEQIRVSTAIAMASNPSLRVIRIKDASLLDDNSMAIVKAMAKEHDFQVWLEVITSNDPMAVVIEDGEIAGHAVEETPAKKNTRKAKV